MGGIFGFGYNKKQSIGKKNKSLNGLAPCVGIQENCCRSLAGERPPRKESIVKGSLRRDREGVTKGESEFALTPPFEKSRNMGRNNFREETFDVGRHL